MNNQNKIKNWYLYILKLQDGKYYVGITSKTPEVRMQEHIHGVRAAYWTAKHKPLQIIHQKNLGLMTKGKAEKHENNMVRAVMKEQGINNVRGGDLTSTDDYIKRFGYIWDRDGWDLITVIIFLLMIIAFLVILYMVKK